MPRNKFWSLVLLALPIGAEPLLLAQAVARSEHLDPSVQADSAQASAVGWQYRAARAAWMPQVAVSGGVARLSRVEGGAVTLPLPPAMGGPRDINIAPQILDQWSLSARADQLLWDGGKAYWQLRAAFWEKRASQKNLDLGKRDARSRIALRYWALLASQSSLAAADTAVQRLDEILRQVRQSYRVGAALETDTLQAYAKHLQAQWNRESLASNRQNLCEALAEALAEPVGTVYELVEDSLPLVAQGEASNVRQELAVAQDKTEAAKASTRAAASSLWWPMVSAYGQWTLADPNPRVIPARDAMESDWRLGVQAQWMVFRGGADLAAQERSRALAQQQEFRLAALRQNDRLERSSAEREAQLARRRWEISGALLVASTREREIAQARVRAGGATHLDLMDKESQWAQAKAERAQALYAWKTAQMKQILSIGQEPVW